MGLKAMAAAATLAVACIAPALAVEEFDTSAGNLIAVLRESPGENHQDEALRPMARVMARLADGREVEIDASWFHYLGDMHVRLVFDGQRSMQTASPGDLARLSLTPEAALALASDNLRRRYGPPQVVPYAAGLLQVTGRSPDLVSSYFFDRDFWLRVAQEHPAGVVVAVPQRGGLVFAPADNALAVTALQFSAVALFTAAERVRISSALYLFKDGRWSVYQPPQQVAAVD